MAVIQNEDGVTYDFVCERQDGTRACEFTSRKWPEVDQAVARRDQHYAEHDTGVPMVELIEFEGMVGFVRPAPEPTVSIDPLLVVVPDEPVVVQPEPTPEA